MTEFLTIDHRNVDWSAIRRASLVVEQELQYNYPGPVHDLQQCLMVVPADTHGGQRLLHHEVVPSTTNSKIQYDMDRFGNRRIVLDIPHVAQSVLFTVRIEVERTISHAVAYCEMQSSHVYLESTPLTMHDDRLKAAAAQVQAMGITGLDLAEALMDWVYRAMRYESDATGVRTSAAQALRLGKGVCQDYAHVMLTLCRLCGLPARYISGHMLGEGGTHAWVEVLVPDRTTPNLGVAVAFDPTHNRRAGPTYITVAVGRDYRDVAPTSGTFRAPYGGQLVARKRAAIASLDPFKDAAA